MPAGRDRSTCPPTHPRAPLSWQGSRPRNSCVTFEAESPRLLCPGREEEGGRISRGCRRCWRPCHAQTRALPAAGDRPAAFLASSLAWLPEGPTEADPDPGLLQPGEGGAWGACSSAQAGLEPPSHRQSVQWGQGTLGVLQCPLRSLFYRSVTSEDFEVRPSLGTPCLGAWTRPSPNGSCCPQLCCHQVSVWGLGSGPDPLRVLRG